VQEEQERSIKLQSTVDDLSRDLSMSMDERLAAMQILNHSVASAKSTSFALTDVTDHTVAGKSSFRSTRPSPDTTQQRINAPSGHCEDKKVSPSHQQSLCTSSVMIDVAQSHKCTRQLVFRRRAPRR
jgi:type IV secretory pathway VirJ component